MFIRCLYLHLKKKKKKKKKKTTEKRKSEREEERKKKRTEKESGLALKYFNKWDRTGPNKQSFGHHRLNPTYAH